MDAIDEIFTNPTLRQANASPLLVCLYTGSDECPSAAPMPRSPQPSIDCALDRTFADHYRTAVDLNPAIHDGAVIVQRIHRGELYRVAGWSYRLYPPRCDATEVLNRGSAFNSCLAMSVLDGLDRVYLVSISSVTRFEQGNIVVL